MVCVYVCVCNIGPMKMCNYIQFIHRCCYFFFFFLKIYCPSIVFSFRFIVVYFALYLLLILRFHIVFIFVQEFANGAPYHYHRIMALANKNKNCSNFQFVRFSTIPSTPYFRICSVFAFGSNDKYAINTNGRAIYNNQNVNSSFCCLLRPNPRKNCAQREKTWIVRETSHRKWCWYFPTFWQFSIHSAKRFI